MSSRGSQKVVMQSDGESSIKLLAKPVAARIRRKGFTCEHRISPRGNHAVFGGAEKAGQDLLGLAHNILMQTQEVFDVKLGAAPLYSWILRHAIWRTR